MILSKMKNLFPPLLAASLASLIIAHEIDLFSGIAQAFILPVFCFCLICYYFKRYAASYIGIVICFALLLAGNYLENKETFLMQNNTPLPMEEYITLRGKVSKQPSFGNNQSLIYLRTESLHFCKSNLQEKLLIRLLVNGRLTKINWGDFIEVSARVSKYRSYKNFFNDPQENWQLYKKVNFSAYCKSSLLVTKIKQCGFLKSIVNNWRNKIRALINQKFSVQTGTGTELDKNGVFLEAILLGDRKKLSKDTKEMMLNAGIYHIMAISGAHIGILAVFSLVLLKIARVSFKTRYVITGAVLLVFLVLSGFSISAQRAVMMALLIFYAKIYSLDISMFNIISFSALLTLLLNPAQFLDPGFVLTYSITAAIVSGRNIFLKYLKWLPKFAREWLNANFSASLVSLPLSIFYFNRYSFTTFFSGILLFPIAGAITGLAVMIIPLSLLPPFLGQGILILLDLLLDLFFTINRLLIDMINLTIFRSPPHLIVVLSIFLGFFVLSGLKKFTIGKILAALILVLSLLYITIKKPAYNPATMEVYFLDVGQGDSQIVVFPGGDSLLIDGGGTYYSDYEIGKSIVLPFLLKKNIRVKWVAISHFHPDHAKGIIEIIDILEPEEVWYSAVLNQNRFQQQLFRKLKKKTIPDKAWSGFVRKISNCQIEYLMPEKFITGGKSSNRNSAIIRVADQNNSFLFTGDTEKQGENRLLESGRYSLKTSVLKVAHHGSGSSSTIPFLQAVSPSLSVFSCGWNNHYNFPEKKILKNHQALGIRYLATSRNGGIQIRSTETGLQISTSR